MLLALVQAHSPVYRCFRALWRGKVAALAFVSVSHPGMWYKACFCHVSAPVSALHWRGPHRPKQRQPCLQYYRKRGSASYIVREVHLVREREIQRERERRKWRHHCRAKIGDEFLDFSLPKMWTLVLATSFALFLAKRFAPQFLPSWMALSSCTLSVAKNVALFETVQ